MCYVAVIPYIALAFTAAAGVYSADSAKKTGEYTQEVAEQNAALDQDRERQAKEIGAIREEEQRQKVRQFAGSQEADFAARGIDLGSGVVTAMLDDTFTLGETDALNVRANAMREAWGYSVSATNNRNEGKFAKWSGNRQAMGTYLSTAGSLMGQGYSGYQSGAFGGSRAGASSIPGTKTGANRKI